MENEERRNHHRFKVEPGVLTLHHSESNAQIGDILDLNQHGMGLLVEQNAIADAHPFLADIYWISARPLVRKIELQLVAKRRVKPWADGKTTYVGRYSVALKKIPDTEQHKFENCLHRYTLVG